MGLRSRMVATRDALVSVVVGRPDAMAVQAASLGAMTNTMSPGSLGRRNGAPAIFTGDRGYGVNRWAGAYPYQAGPVQQYGAAAAPVLAPVSARLGFGALPTGQPGLPNTGAQTGDGALAWLSAYQMSGGMGT